MPKDIMIPSPMDLADLQYQFKLRTGTDVINANTRFFQRLFSNTNDLAEALYVILLQLGYVRSNDLVFYRFPSFFLLSRNTLDECLQDISNGNFNLINGTTQPPEIGDVIILYPRTQPDRMALYRLKELPATQLSNWIQLESGGSGTRNVRLVTDDTTLQNSDYLLRVNVPSSFQRGNLIVTLIEPSQTAGREFVIVKEDTRDVPVLITVPNLAGFTINGNTFYTLKHRYEAISILSNGADSYIVKSS